MDEKQFPSSSIVARAGVLSIHGNGIIEDLLHSPTRFLGLLRFQLLGRLDELPSLLRVVRGLFDHRGFEACCGMASDKEGPRA